MSLKLLNELNEITNLSDSQKAILAIAFFSATPRQAFAATLGSDKLIYAREILTKLGFIKFINDELALTPIGVNALSQYNLKDETDQPTNEAKMLLKSVNRDEDIID